MKRTKPPSRQVMLDAILRASNEQPNRNYRSASAFHCALSPSALLVALLAVMFLVTSCVTPSQPANPVTPTTAAAQAAAPTTTSSPTASPVPTLAATSTTAPATATNTPVPSATPEPTSTPFPDAPVSVFGPRSGSVPYTSAQLNHQAAGLAVKDFDAEASFINPDTSSWGYGFTFRASEQFASYYAFLLDETKVCSLFKSVNKKLEIVTTIDCGPGLETDAAARNLIGVKMRGDKLKVTINSQPAADMALSGIDEAGDVTLAAWNPDNKNVGTSLKYENFVVRAFSADVLKPTATATKIPAPTTKPKPAPTTETGAQPTAAATPKPAAQPPAKGGIVLTAYPSGYIQWGRPAGMVEKGKGCGDFDDSHPVRQYQAKLHIQNNSGKALTNWYMIFEKESGGIAYTCYYVYLPEIAAGQGADVTFGAFVELGDAIKDFFVVTEEGIVSNILKP